MIKHARKRPRNRGQGELVSRSAQEVYIKNINHRTITAITITTTPQAKILSIFLLKILSTSLFLMSHPPFYLLRPQKNAIMANINNIAVTPIRALIMPMSPPPSLFERGKPATN